MTPLLVVQVDFSVEYSLKMEHESFSTNVKIMNACSMMSHGCRQILDCDRATFYLNSHFSIYRLVYVVYHHRGTMDLAVVVYYGDLNLKSLLMMTMEIQVRFDH